MQEMSDAKIAKEMSSHPVKSLRHRLVHGVKWAMIGAGFAQGLGMLTAILVANFLGKEGFGKYGIIQNTVGMFGVFAGMAMGYTATKHIAEFKISDPQRAGRFMGLTILLGLYSSLVMVILVFAFSDFVANNILKEPSLLTTLYLSIPLLALNTFFDIQIAGMVGLESFKKIASVSSLVSVITLPCVIIGVYFFQLNGAITGFVVARMLACIISHIALRKSCREHGFHIIFSGHKKDWIKTWKFSLPSMLSNIIANPANWICQILLVNQKGGFSQMGLYQAAFQWQAAVSFIPMRIMGVALPILTNLFSQKDFKRYYKVIKMTQTVIFVIAFSVAAPIMIFSKIIMRAYGEGFTEGNLVLVLLLIAGTFILFERSLSEVLLARDKPVSKMVVYFVSSLLSVLLFWQVFLELGVIGLCYSLCIAHFIGVCMLLVYIVFLSVEDKKRF